MEKMKTFLNVLTKCVLCFDCDSISALSIKPFLYFIHSIKNIYILYVWNLLILSNIYLEWLCMEEKEKIPDSK